jgi:hypothetical protein
VFVGNDSHDYGDATACQGYGYQEQAGGLVNLFSIANNYAGNKFGAAQYNSTGGQQNVDVVTAQKLLVQAMIDQVMKDRLFALAGEQPILRWLGA